MAATGGGVVGFLTGTAAIPGIGGPIGFVAGFSCGAASAWPPPDDEKQERSTTMKGEENEATSE